MGEICNVQPIFMLALGHPLLDIQANVCERFLRKYDVEANGAILKGPKQEGLYEELLQKNFKLTYVPGGAAQNTMKMIQWIHQDSKEIQCAYLGCIGADTTGEILLESIHETGVKTLYEVTDKLGTGVCFVLVNGSQRSLVTSLGAAAALSTNFLRQKRPWEMVKAAQIYYIIGYLVVSSMDIVKLILDHASSHSKALCLNLASPYVARSYTEALDTVIPHADFIFGTVDEAEAYAEARLLNDRNALGVAKYLVSLPRAGNICRPRLVVLTQGPGPIYTISSRDQVLRTFSVTPLPLENIVDTNGAGDAFAAGFLASYLIEGDLEKAIDSGKKAATYIIKRSGFSLGPRVDYT
ncbi:Adenosine kinase 2 [Echinococcus granulosus]|uniref:Adenosine kinase n=1 Tax=Echinococcus granulosus TaxID=6210 RepID=U6JIY7_ECHGR|nr:Adenosine kinase 2 [Echinococcus granulosus]EUB60914.1 Adenosine kinase 2 [Echinococcus granulosus]KAH9284342.1 Adenosine kinase 2 [Echinococcus granulosus]CDS21748.1 adenosine kinase [Echinococcus granulosus]